MAWSRTSSPSSTRWASIPRHAGRCTSRMTAPARWGCDVTGRRIEIRGTVQGVGFRPWVYRVAHELGVAGRVHNHARGVTVDAFARASDLDALSARLREPPLP